VVTVPGTKESKAAGGGGCALEQDNRPSALADTIVLLIPFFFWF
jgi:hypothetical protein